MKVKSNSIQFRQRKEKNEVCATKKAVRYIKLKFMTS
jgi:hypothetical protein